MNVYIYIFIKLYIYIYNIFIYIYIRNNNWVLVVGLAWAKVDRWRFKVLVGFPRPYIYGHDLDQRTNGQAPYGYGCV